MKLIDSMIEGAQIADNAGTLEYLNRFTSALVDAVQECCESPAKAVYIVGAALERTNDQMREEGY